MFKIKTRNCFKSALPSIQRTNSAENEWSSIKLSTNFTFTAENPYNLPFYSMPSDHLHLVRRSSIFKNQRPTRVNFILPTSQQIWTLQTGSTRCSREQPVMQRPRYRKVSVRSAHILIPVGVRKFTYASRNGLLISYVNLRTKVGKGN